MNTASTIKKITTTFCTGLLGLSFLLPLTNVNADPISAELQAKVEKYKLKLVEWAANPTIIAAAKEANEKGAMAGMNNAKWDDLKDDSPEFLGLKTSAAGQMLLKWEEDKAISKLYARDFKGNIVAASSKPLLFNNASRPPFVNAIKGEPFSAKEAKPDPTTSVMSVQISVPIMDGSKVIGILHSSVNQ